MDCIACCEPFTSQTRKQITCISCDCSYCRKCTETYLLGILEEPHCMNCKKTWSPDFVRTIMTKTFCDTKLKKHREDTLYEKEKSLLPATQVYVEIEIKKEKIRNKVCDLLKQRLEIDKKIKAYQSNFNSLNNPEVIEDETKKQKFIRKCPAQECRGFLSTSYKCGICNIYACAECKEIKGFSRDEPHECDKDILESVKMIESDSKTCPNCAVIIFRTEGCSQMFCVECNTVFDWKTLKINNGGAVHNPHYFEWVQRNGGEVRQFGDIPCGGLPRVQELERNIRGFTKYVLLLDILRITNEIANYHINNYPVDSLVNGNRDLRIKFLRQFISEEEFKRQLQMREKKSNRNTWIRQIIDTYVTVATENIRDIFEMKENYLSFKEQELEIDKRINNLEEIREYTNEQLSIVSKRLSCSVLQIREDWKRVVLGKA
jgi:hypothetical protein